jgi:hypothetical protein
MGIRRIRLCLALLAMLTAADATASTTGSNLSAGEVRLAFSPDKISALPIDVQALAEDSCGTTFLKVGPLVQCRLKAEPAPSSEIKTEFQSGPPLCESEEGFELMQWRVTSLSIAGAQPVETSCGAWDVSLRLDTGELEATDPQPISPMALKPDADDPGRGTFAGVLEMRARLHLANRTTGQAVDHSLGLRLGLAGPWILDPTQGNLLLLLGWRGQCFPVWVVTYSEELGRFLSGECQFCLTVAPRSGGSIKRLP